jgi:tripartite-type tricarboxylate transporter receptor subunit TctC
MSMSTAYPAWAAPCRPAEVKALAVASDKRLDSVPDVPLVSDTLPNFQAKGWFVLLAPAKTPEPVVKKLGGDLRTALRDPDLKRRFEVIGTFPRPSTVEETNAFIKTEQDRWRPIVRQIGTE